MIIWYTQGGGITSTWNVQHIQGRDEAGSICWPWTHVTQMNLDPGPSKLIEKSQNSLKLAKQFSNRFQKGRNLIDKANINWCNIAQF